MARVFDKAGNSNLSNPIRSLQFLVARVGIESFTVSPSSVQFPGGPVTLSWSVKGATQISIDNGGGTFAVPDNAITATPGSTTVNVTGTTTFTLTATHPMRTTKTATVTVTLGADATPPSVSLAASPNPVVAPGSTTLAATASDNASVTKVEFYRGAALIGTDTTAPFAQAVSFTPADIGTVGFTAKAFDAANNSTTSAVVNVTVGADTTPPTSSLLANPATVLVPGATTLQATVSDNIGVTKVEFYRGSTLIATDIAAPFQTQVDFTAADLGTATFTAKAFDAQNNNTTSAAVNVLVTHAFRGRHLRQPDRHRCRQHDLLAGQPLPLDRPGGGDGAGEQDGVADERRLHRRDPAGADRDSRRVDAARADAWASPASARRSFCRATRRWSASCCAESPPATPAGSRLRAASSRSTASRRRARTLPAVCRRSRSPAPCR